MQFEPTTWIYITAGSSFGMLLLGYIVGRAGNTKRPLSRIAKSTSLIAKILSDEKQ